MIELTQKEYEKYRKKGQKTNEGYVFLNPKNKKKIIKVIESRPNSPKYLGNKIYTIGSLIRNYDYLHELNIAMPEEGVIIENEPRGYSAQVIKGEELLFYLSNTDVPIDMKISSLKQVGKLLRDMALIRKKYPHLSDFYYNDIHERNFIVTNQGILYGIDVDSCRIQGNIPVQGLYSLSLIEQTTPEISKYSRIQTKSPEESAIIPDENLDIYCYIRMIVNFISGKQLLNLTPKMLNDYLNYLASKGANLELLYAISSIYNDSKDNINPDYLLDYIKEMYSYSNIRYDQTGEVARILRR